MRIAAQSPCRVDLAGGTLDIWPLYLFHENATTINFAITRFTRCELRSRDDGRYILRSQDQGVEETFASFESLRTAPKYRLPLLAHTLRYFAPDTGLEMETHSESPAGAGISGSSSLMVTMVSALNALTGRRLNKATMLEIARNVEAQVIHVPTGWQDYHAAMYGGVSAIELTPAGAVHRRITIDAADFRRRIVLAYTGEPRSSGINNWEVTKAHVNGDGTVTRNFERIAAIAYAMRGALERSDWKEVACLIRDEWANRKKNAPGITTSSIDALIDKARKAGAAAAKVCGAGGGGCVFFLVEPEARKTVRRAVMDHGAELLDVAVAHHGVRVRVEAK